MYISQTALERIAVVEMRLEFIGLLVMLNYGASRLAFALRSKVRIYIIG
jgi:hypothetical protein